MARIDLLKRVMDGLELEEAEARQFLAKLTPTVQIDDLEPAETTPQPKWRQCIGGYYQAAVAAQYAMAHVRNWPGSGVLLVIDELIVTLSSSGTWLLYEDATGYAALTTYKAFTDRRLQGLPVGQFRYGANAAHQGDTVLAQGYGLANNPVVIKGPFLIDGGAAGQAIGIETGAQNIGLNLIARWRERNV